MAESTRVPLTKEGRSKLTAKVYGYLEQREPLEAKIAKATARRDAAKKRAEERFKKEVGDAPAELEALDAEFGPFIDSNRYWLTRKHSKTMVSEQGEVKLMTRAYELEMPATEGPVIEKLKQLPDGYDYLIPNWKVNRTALTRAPAEILAALRPFGVWLGRHRTVSVNSPSSKSTKRVVSIRHYERKLKQRSE